VDNSNSSEIRSSGRASHYLKTFFGIVFLERRIGNNLFFDLCLLGLGVVLQGWGMDMLLKKDVGQSAN
jgi:hypothetical protein